MGRYNDRIRALSGNKRGKRQFIQLYRNVKRSTNYHGLSAYARALLLELIDRFNGCNNGMIGLGVREAKYELQCSQGRISTAMRELDDAGLARPTKIGAWRGKRATEWRLMFLRCDKTHDAPVTVWEQRKPHSEFTLGYAQVHAGVHREPLSSRGSTQKPNSSMSDQGLSSRGDTHIDIYQGPGERLGLTAEGEREAILLAGSLGNQGAKNNVGLSANPKNPRKRRKP